MVIVDDPQRCRAAFDEPGGYLATKYLDDNLVSRRATP
jgi:hypothetical protein